MSSYNVPAYYFSAGVASFYFQSLFTSSTLRGTVYYFTRCQLATSVWLIWISREPKNRKGHNWLVCLSPVISVACSSRTVFFLAGDKYCEFLCYNFQCFSRLNCVSICTSVNWVCNFWFTVPEYNMSPRKLSKSDSGNSSCYGSNVHKIAFNVYNFF
jgi:hypothetical protein